MKSNYQRCGSSIMGTEKQKESELTRLEKSGKYFAQSKCDGIFASIAGNGKDNLILSRNNKEKAYNLPILPTGTLITGELGYGSEESTTRMKQIGHEFMDVYDILILNGKSTTMLPDWERFQLLTTFIKSLPKKYQEFYLLVPTYSKNFVKHYREENEGLVLKSMSENSEYIAGSTNVNWIKVKHEYDFDMILMDYEISDATTKVNVPMAKNLIVGQYVEGELKEMTKVGSLPLDLCEDVVANFHKYMGRVLTVHGYKRFKSGAVRHPSFIGWRDDKDPKDCIFNLSEC